MTVAVREARAVTLRVQRWSREEPERQQAYRVARGPDTTVLDALVDIQRGQDHTLAFRYACRVGMCGSCAVVVNGRERWACRTRLAALGTDVVDLRPLYHMPVVRDLVVDMAPFQRGFQALDAAFAPRPQALAYARVAGDSAERREIDEAIECIGCGMCVSACTMVASHPRFPGPAALNRAFTLTRDQRDGAAADRWRALVSDDALPRCHGQGNCTAVCPMGLAPGTAIAWLKRRAVRRLFGGP